MPECVMPVSLNQRSVGRNPDKPTQNKLKLTNVTRPIILEVCNADNSGVARVKWGGDEDIWGRNSQENFQGHALYIGLEVSFNDMLAISDEETLTILCQLFRKSECKENVCSG